MDCAGQMDRVLEPGESFKLSVTFTPDFYLSRLSEPLLLITSTGITQFPLEVTLPHHLLAACHERSPRSQWEQQCHSVTVAILSVGLVALLLLTLRDMAADLRLDLAARTAAAAAAAVVSPARTSLKKEPLPTTPTKPSPAPPDCIPEKDEPRLKISAAPASAAVDPSRVRRPSEVAATEKAKKQKKKKAPTVDVASPPAALPPHAPDSPSATASQQHRTATASTASISSAMEAEILSPQPRDVPMPSFAPRASSAPSFPPTESTPPPSPQKRVEPKKSPPAAPTTIRSARSPPPPSPKKELKAAAIPVLPTRPTLPQLPDSLSPAPSLKPSSTAFHPYANPNPEPPSNPFSNPATFSLLSTPQFGAPQRSSFQPATASASLSSAGGLFASDPWAAPPLSLPHHHQSASPSLPSDLYAATFNSPIHHQHSSKPTLPPGMPRVPLGHQRHQRQSSDTLDLLLPGGLPTFSPLEPVEPPPSDLERRRRLLAHGSATFPPAAAPLSSVQGLQQSRLGGMRDSLSSIGLARLGAESELGNRVYSIWGDDSAAALPSFHLQPPRAEPAARNGNGGSSFFNFPLSMDEMDDSLEPDSGAANEPAAAAGAFNSPSGGMFSMFSLPQDAHATSHTFFGNDAKWT